jgi:hypothetical protein
VLLRADALEHLLSVVRIAAEPLRDALSEEFVSRQDFRAWLEATQHALPSFWFDQSDSASG